MDERMVREIARREGLEKALAEFPDDVVAAAISAAKVTETIRQSGLTASERHQPEPWPPMVVVRK